MKRHLFLFMVATLAVCLIAGCGGPTPTPTPSPSPTPSPTPSPSPSPSPTPSLAPYQGVVYTDPLVPITIGVNKDFVISLEYSGTGSGFDWFEGYDATMLDLLTQEYKPGVDAGSMFASPATSAFRFKALRTGSTRITFAYKRPWEVIPSRQSVFNIEIQ